MSGTASEASERPVSDEAWWDWSANFMGQFIVYAVLQPNPPGFEAIPVWVFGPSRLRYSRSLMVVTGTKTDIPFKPETLGGRNQASYLQAGATATLTAEPWWDKSDLHTPGTSRDREL